MNLAFDWVDSTCSPEPHKRITRPSQLLASAPEFDQTLVQLAGWPAPHSVVGRYALGWNAAAVASGARTRTLSHPGGARMAYTASNVTGIHEGPVHVGGFGRVYNAIKVLERVGLTEGGSSGSPLVLEGPGLQLVGALSHGPDNTAQCQGLAAPTPGYGGFRDFFPRIAHLIGGSGPVEPPRHVYRVPLVLRSRPEREGFVRLSNLAEASARVSVSAFDDRGQQCGPTSLVIGPLSSVHFTATHLERGGRGFAGCGAPSAATAHWRLEVVSDAPLATHGYVRTADGFVTSMQQAAELLAAPDGAAAVHGVPFLNPGRNNRQRSLLRVTNHEARRTVVRVALYDDEGRLAEPEEGQSVGPGQTLSVSSQVLERRLGSGTGKWKGVVYATPAADLTVLSILDTPTGHVTNVSR